MKQFGVFFFVLLGLAAQSVPAKISGSTAVYAIVDRVVFEPSAYKPERIQVWGAFVTPNPAHDDFLPPQKGLLYFTLPPSRWRITDVVRREWKDLSGIAGSRQVMAFCNLQNLPRVRGEREKPGMPDVYWVNVGVQKIRGSGYPPIKALLEFK
jgi:hypothetical protein